MDITLSSGGRTPGGVDYAVAVAESLAPLPPSADFVVGVVDTGIVVDRSHQPHPWLAGHVSYGAEDEDRLGEGRGTGPLSGFLADADGHGTFVSGLILREAPAARVAMCGVLDKGGTGATLGDEDDERVTAAIRSLALDPNVQVVNLSFGGGVFATESAATNLGRALAELDHERVAVVAAAGNSASLEPVWPASFPHVIAVGALDERLVIPPGATPPFAAFTNQGDWVDAYTGGVQVLSTFVDYDETGADEFGLHPPQRHRGWARWSGTSFAAAIVSGRIAQVAIERGVTGAHAAKLVLAESRRITSSGAVWIA